jgi:tetratricopeptide (TPR) repeat protein
LSAALAAVSKLADSVVVYPGEDVPEPLQRLAGGPESVLTCRDVKGLDFQTVTVLQAADRLGCYKSELLEPAHDTAASMLTVRMTADQLRVAFSRATERLVLLEWGTTADSVRQLQELVGPSVRVVTAQALSDELASEATSLEDLVVEMCDELEKLVETHPNRCYQRAAWALQRLGAPADLATVPGLQRLQFWAGLSAVRSARAVAPGSPRPDEDLRLDQAIQWFSQGGHEVEARFVKALREGTKAGESEPSSELEVHPLLRASLESFRRVPHASAEKSADTPDRDPRSTRQPSNSRHSEIEPEWRGWRVELETADRLLALSDLRAAERHCRRLVDSARGLAPRDGRVAVSLARLGTAQILRGFWGQAAQTLQRALALLDSLGGPKSPELVGVLSHLGRANVELDRTEEAERLIRRALEIQVLLGVPDETDRLSNMLQLARLVVLRGEFDEARTLIDEVLEKVGPDDVDLEATALRRRSELFDLLGRTSESERDRRRLASLGATLPREARLGALRALSEAQLIARVYSGKVLESDDACLELIRRGPVVVAEILRAMCEQVRAEGPGTPCPEEAEQATAGPTDAAMNRGAVTAGLGVVLGHLGSKALPQVREAARDSDAKVRSEMVRVLGAIAMSAPEAEADLLRALGDPSAKVRSMAAHRLGFLTAVSPEAVAALKLAASSGKEDMEVETNAVLALAALREELPFVLPILEGYLQDELLACRVFALVAAQKLGGAARPLLPAILANLEHPQALVRRLALAAGAEAWEMASEIEDWVAPFVDDEDKETRDLAVWLLGQVRPHAKG